MKALITGASSGLGREMARLLAARGYIQQRFIRESKECKQNQEPTRRVLGRQRFLWISVRS